MLSDAELDAIEARAKAATAAPWCTGSIPWQVWFNGGYGKICRIESNAADRDFIAQARQDVPTLIEEVRRLRKAFSGGGAGAEQEPGSEGLKKLAGDLAQKVHDLGKHFGTFPFCMREPCYEAFRNLYQAPPFEKGARERSFCAGCAKGDHLAHVAGPGLPECDCNCWAGFPDSQLRG